MIRANAHEQVLRRALHAAADGIEPDADGLERIRARLTVPAPLPLAWFSAAFAAAGGLLLGTRQALSEQLPSIWTRRRQPRAGRSWPRTLLAATAMAVAVTVVGALTLTRLPSQITQSLSAVIPFTAQSTGSATGSGSTASSDASPLLGGPGSGQHGFVYPFPVAKASSAAHRSAHAAPTMPPSATPAPPPSPAPSIAPSPTSSSTAPASPSPTPTPDPSSASPSPSPTSPSPTATDPPSVSASPEPSGD